MTNLERYYPGLRADAFKPTEGSMAVDPATKRTMPCSDCKAYESCRKSLSVTFVEAVNKYEVESVAVLVEEVVGGHAEGGLCVRVHVDLLLALDSAEVRAVGGPDFEEGTEAAFPYEIVKQVGSCVHYLPIAK